MLKRLSISLLTASLLLTQSAEGRPKTSASQHPDNGKITVFALAQRSSALGEQIVYIGPHHLRLQSKRTGCTFLVSPPGKKVYIVNDIKQAYFESALDTWRDPSGAVEEAKASYKDYLKVRALGQTTVCGMPAYEYVKDDKGKKTVHYWLAKDIPISPGARQLLEKSLGDAAPIDRMPLQITRFALKKKQEVPQSTLLSTTEFKRMDVDPSAFTVPPGYKPAETELDVFVDLNASELDGINSIIYKFNESGELPTKQDLKDLKSTFKKGR